MSQDKPVVKKWAEPTPKQRLSHRSILRFVELAENLACDLRRILFPKAKNGEEGVFDVYFISAARHRLNDLEPHRVGRNGIPVRYYNLRLLKTFRLIDVPHEQDPIKPVWDWIKNNCALFQPLFQCADYLEEHSRDHYRLFAQCIEEASKANEGGKQERDIAARVHDLLIEAIAAMPYTGLLPSALDQWFYGKKWDLEKIVPVRFHLKYSDKKVLFSNSPGWNSEEAARERPLTLDPDKLIPVKAFRAPDQARNHARELGELYVRYFINWFTLGIVPNEPKEGSKNHCIYVSGNRDLEGFALPIYHYHDQAGNQFGGFEGWAILMGKDHKDAYAKLRRKKTAVTLAIRAFSRRIREERMRELLEKEWLATSDIRTFTLKHFGDFDGWIAETRDYGGLPTLEDHWQFAFLAGTEERIDGPQGMADAISFTVYDKRDAAKPGPREHDPRNVTHIAVFPPTDRDQPSDRGNPLIFRKRHDTILPEFHEDIVDYGFHITRAVGQIYNAARLKEHSAKAAAQAATDVLSDDFAHQIQHVAVALSKRWLVSRDSYQRLTENPHLPHDIIANYRVAPLPSLFQHVEAVLSLWSAKKANEMTWDAPRTLANALTLSDACNTAAKYAASEFIAFELKSKTLTTSENILKSLQVVRRAEALQRRCNFKALNIYSVPFPVESQDDFLISVVRLFEALICNAFLHSEQPVRAVHSDEIQFPCFALVNKVGKSRHKDKGGNGERTIQRLAIHLSFTILPGEFRNDEYWRLIRVPSVTTTARGL